MKKLKILLLLIIPVLLLTGCTKRYDLKYENAKLAITFSPDDEYEIKEDIKYFRTAREKAIIIGPSFKVGLELNDTLYTEKIKFKEFKKKYKSEEDFKEVEYSGMKGFQFYTPAYLRYEIYLPIDDQIILRLNVYSANDKKKFTTKELESKEVQDLLNHIKVEVKK